MAQIDLIVLGFIELLHYKLLLIIHWLGSPAEVIGKILCCRATEKGNLYQAAPLRHMFGEKYGSNTAKWKLSCNACSLVSYHRWWSRQQPGITGYGRRGWPRQEAAEETRHLPQSGHKYNESMALSAPYSKWTYADPVTFKLFSQTGQIHLFIYSTLPCCQSSVTANT